MPPKGDGVNSIIGHGSVFEGKYHVDGAIQIDGKFEGDLEAEQQIIIGETGLVKTSTILKSQKVTIAGSVIGDVVAKEMVILLENSKMIGNIETPFLQVEKGIVFEGHIKINAGQNQDIKKLVNAEFDAVAGLSENNSSQSKNTAPKNEHQNNGSQQEKQTKE